ncbi:MAG: hypothetical protein QME58_12480 [Bacteroidota bacterium]|nr:hypothetical protein [Bacteroidota bacterium]
MMIIKLEIKSPIKDKWAVQEKFYQLGKRLTDAAIVEGLCLSTSFTDDNVFEYEKQRSENNLAK